MTRSYYFRLNDLFVYRFIGLINGVWLPQNFFGEDEVSGPVRPSLLLSFMSVSGLYQFFARTLPRSPVIYLPISTYLQSVLMPSKQTQCFLVLTQMVVGVMGWAYLTSITTGHHTYSADISPDNQYLAASLLNGHIEIFAMSNYSLLRRHTSYSILAKTLRYSPDQKYIAVGFEAGGVTAILDGNPPFDIITNLSTLTTVHLLDFSPDSTKLMTCGTSPGLRIYQSGTWSLLYTETIWPQILTRCNFAENGDIAVAQFTGYIRTYFANMTERWTVRPNTIRRWGLRLSPTGDKLAIGDQGSSVFVYNPITVASPVVYFAAGQMVFAIDWSPDEAYWVFGGPGDQIDWYNGTAGHLSTKIYSFTEPSNVIEDVRFSRNGQYLIASGREGKVFIYEGTPVYTINPPDDSNSSRIFPGCPLEHYQKPTNTCQKCSEDMKGCRLCQNGSVCLGCSDHYYLQSSSGTCLECTSIHTACLQCNQAGQCLKCLSQYYLSTVSSCAPCGTAMEGCTWCTNSSSCSMCVEGKYYLDSFTDSCISCTSLDLCIECSSSSYCQVCQPGFYTLNGTCLPCESSCSSCLSSSTCLSCNKGSYLDGSNCSSCQLGCSQCTAASCLACQSGYYLDTAICILCDPGCWSCHNSTACVSCLPGFFEANSTCLSCQQHHPECQLCSSSSCDWCSSGFYLASSTTCLSCTTSLAHCRTCFSSTICQSCDVGTYLEGSTCLPCPCPSCTNFSSCLSCDAGYFLEGGSCLVCQTGCDNCLSYDNCTDCQTGWYLDCQMCIPCLPTCLSCNSSTGCQTCAAGWFQAGSMCQQCPVACTTCANSSWCQECLLGFYHINGTCLSCETLWQGCSSCNMTNCFSCQSPYLLNLTCERCSSLITHCIACSSLTQCDSCMMGYFWDSSRCVQCSLFMDNCQVCSGLLACQSCYSGYYLLSGDCVRCSSSCLSCVNSTVCSKCPEESYLVNQTCVLCSTSIDRCLRCSSPTSCSRCSDGFYLANSTCLPCSQTIPGCSLCLGNATCTACNEFFLLNSSLAVCSPCNSSFPDCVICSESSCLVCAIGTVISGASCQPCPASCTSCDSASVCFSCHTGYFLYSNQCHLCSSMFDSCYQCSAAQCQSCLSGYGLNSTFNCASCQVEGCLICPQINQCVGCNLSYFQGYNTCLPCGSTMSYCATCSSPSVCLTCVQGYIINGSSCVSCSVLHPLCSTCSDTGCIECQLGSWLNSSSTCSPCQQGCAYCSSDSECTVCHNGYYLNGTQCLSCSSQQGCLLCDSVKDCVRCSIDYYLQNGSCHNCNHSLPFCTSCASKHVCLSCQGAYQLTNGSCSPITVVSRAYSHLYFYSEYINETTLKHTLARTQGKFDVDSIILTTLQAQLTISYLSSPQPAITFNITSISISEHRTSLIVYTQNPLTHLSQNIYQGIPRLLAQSNLQIQGAMQLTVSPSAMTILESEDKQDHSQLTRYYSLQEPKFSRSLTRANSVPIIYYAFGIAVSIYLVLFSLMKGLLVLPLNHEKAEIVSHVLFLKTAALIVYPSYAEMQEFCRGFMSADLPYFNFYFHSLVGEHLYEDLPAPYQLYYDSLHIAATYPLPLIIFPGLCLLLAPLILRKCCCYQSAHALIQLCYDVWLGGLAVASCSCLLYALDASNTQVTKMTLMYLVGIALYLSIVTHSFTCAVGQPSKIYRLRIVIKGSLLSLAHYDPVSLTSLMVVGQIVMMRYQLCSKRIKCPKLWIFSHATVNIALYLLIFFTGSSTILFIVSGLVILVLILEFIRLCKDHSSPTHPISSQGRFNSVKETQQNIFTNIDENTFSELELKPRRQTIREKNRLRQGKT